MRLRIAANILKLVFIWVLWEKWLMGPPSDGSQHRIIEAVSEYSSLKECQTGMTIFARRKAAQFRDVQKGKESNYQLLEGDSRALLADKTENTVSQYVYYCLPPTIDPYKHPD